MSNYRELVEERLEFNLLPPNQYFEVVCVKKSVGLHHTAGGSADSSIATWIADPDRVATPVLIERDGAIIQSYPSKFFAYSFGIKAANRDKIEKQTIPIEICSYGYLKKVGNEYFNAYGGKVKDVCILDKPWRGQKYFENYTDAQIESVRRLLLYWGEKYSIKFEYSDKMWDIWQKAQIGDASLVSHACYRTDKTDAYPHPKLIEMLKNLYN